MRKEFLVSTAGLSVAFGFVAETDGRDGTGRAAALRLSMIVEEICAKLLRHGDRLTGAARFAVELEEGPGGSVPVIPEPGRPSSPLEARPGRARKTGSHGLALIRGLSPRARSERVAGRNRLILSIPAGG